MQRLVAEPSRWVAVAPALLRCVRVAVQAASMRGAPAARRPNGAREGLFQLAIEYLCVGVELFVLEQTLTGGLGPLALANKTWVAAELFPRVDRHELVVTVDTAAAAAPRPLGCSTSHVDRQAIRTTFTGDPANSSAVPYAYGDTSEEAASLSQDTIESVCTLYTRSGAQGVAVDIPPAHALASEASTPLLLAAAINNQTDPPRTPAAGVRSAGGRSRGSCRPAPPRAPRRWPPARRSRQPRQRSSPASTRCGPLSYSRLCRRWLAWCWRCGMGCYW